MPSTAKIYRFFFASPSDVAREKTIVRKLAEEWNRLHGEVIGVRIEVSDWTSHSFPFYGQRTQSLINQQVFDYADVVVGLFWTRFGSPTGVAKSGTEEEILRAVKQKKPLMLYFSEKPVNPSKVDVAQYGQVIQFKDKHKDKALYRLFDSDKAFELKFREDLCRMMHYILGRSR